MTVINPGGGSKLRLPTKELRSPQYNVKGYGAKGDGIHDDTTAVKEALAAAAVSGGQVVVPAGTYIISSTLTIADNVALIGDGREASILKLAAGSAATVLKTAAYASGGAADFILRDIGFDGNKSGGSTGSPVVDIDGLGYQMDHVLCRNGAAIGLRSIPFTRADPGFGMEARVSDLACFENVSENLVWEGPHDSILDNVIAASFNVGTGTNILAKAISNWSNCHTYGNTEKGWVCQSGNFFNCQAEGTKAAKVEFTESGVQWIGGRVFSAGAGDGKVGFVFGGGNGHMIYDTTVENCDNGAFDFAAECFSTMISGLVYGSTAKPAIIGTPAPDLDCFGLQVREPMTLMVGGKESKAIRNNNEYWTSGDINVNHELFLKTLAGGAGGIPEIVGLFVKKEGAKTQICAQFPGGSIKVLGEGE